MAASEDPVAVANAKVSVMPHYVATATSVTACEEGRCTMRLPWDERFASAPGGALHSGAILTLLDNACGLAVRSSAAAARVESFATLDLRVDHLRPASPGRDLHATAECHFADTEVAFVRGFAWEEAAEDPVATCSASFKLDTPRVRLRP